MNSLEKYIEEIKKETELFNELETIRYVYIKLGQKMTFDLNFAFGEEKTKENIYKNCFYNLESLNTFLEKETITCRALAFLLEYILKELGINIATIYAEDCSNNYPHVYNLIKLQDGKIYKVDLQRDLEYIQANLRTQGFGIADNESKNLSREELEKIDKRIGYISKEKYYADDYYYLVKSVVDTMSKINEKVEFILNNISPYDNYQKMRYGETRWYFTKQLSLYLTSKEKSKVQAFDMYTKIGEENSYILCFMIYEKNRVEYIYLYNKETNLFENISLDEFNNKLENGLNSVENSPRLRRRK